MALPWLLAAQLSIDPFRRNVASSATGKERHSPVALKPLLR